MWRIASRLLIQTNTLLPGLRQIRTASLTCGSVPHCLLLDKRLVFVACSVQNKGAGMAYDAPPLPVAMALGGEPNKGCFSSISKERVPGETSRWRFSEMRFEHGIVPVVRSKKSTYTLFFNGFVVGYTVSSSFKPGSLSRPSSKD